ncbi:MAG: copper amine oxidase N-terminal domain-containing protein, partial [Armatimonadetes bacterium]|nr:copper amine oxidase N-terminal domain-containing protein [Armatimonadota bacterium]
MNLTLALLLNLGVSLAAPPLELSPPACQIAGVTMVPGRALAEWLGASAALDASGRELTVQIQGRAGSLRFAAGHGRAVVVGLPAALPHVPIRAANDLYVPLRFLAEQLETTVAWDAAAR